MESQNSNDKQKSTKRTNQQNGHRNCFVCWLPMKDYYFIQEQMLVSKQCQVTQPFKQSNRYFISLLVQSI